MHDALARGRVGRAVGRSTLLLATAGFALVCAAGSAPADDPVTQDDLQVLMRDLQEQKKKLAAQEQALAEQQRVIANQQNQLNFLKVQVGLPDDPELIPVAYNLGNAVPSGTVAGVLQAQDEEQSDDKKPVGEAPEQTRPQIAVIQDQGGVLTREGQLIIEPSVQYTHSSQNRFFFSGFEVVDTVLIGLIEATRADRNLIQASLGARVGVTDRLEIEARIPYVYRSDRVRNEIPSLPGRPQFNFDADGNGIGDIEAAAHYDFTDLIFDAPYEIYTVANLKVKAPTGDGPFDVPLDSQGNPLRLATGSGFFAVQPSFTAIFPTDPVVFFGTAGYTINIGRDINQTRNICIPGPPPAGCTDVFQDETVGEVEPGDAVNASVGMGLSLNERTSVSFGFQFDYVFPSQTKVQTLVFDPNNPQNPPTISDVTAESDPLYIGSFTMGWAYQISDNVGLNLNFAVGATENAPDFQTTLRVPIRFQIF